MGKPLSVKYWFFFTVASSMAGKDRQDAWKKKYEDLEGSVHKFRQQASKIKDTLGKEVRICKICVQTKIIHVSLLFRFG